jgi:hypothetical protein
VSDDDLTILAALSAAPPCAPWLAATFCVFAAPAGFDDAGVRDANRSPQQPRA